ncbi:hypothetical protein GZH46_02349 [Fragariocoptes setiger]|uniref:Uncharacterized protein n=1 Tax=Fragariocoptes setiger TaxID=1670756 RepID=A0ABQ7S6X8_9ACAR|nr:hypothetical protein GZH46_02349 [Fragariocoptes setiger]
MSQKLSATTIVLGALISVTIAMVQTAMSQPAPAAAAAPGTPPVIEPIIDWGKCPQLAPTEQQRKQKTDIIKTCLELNPLNATQEQLNAEMVEKHRIKLGECALKKEDWFNADNTYKYDKAENELKRKDVEASIKSKLLEHHEMCRKQAVEKFSTDKVIIEQVQFYQSCLDYHASNLCGIKIMLPPQ